MEDFTEAKKRDAIEAREKERHERQRRFVLDKEDKLNFYGRRKNKKTAKLLKLEISKFKGYPLDWNRLNLNSEM